MAEHKKSLGESAAEAGGAVLEFISRAASDLADWVKELPKEDKR